MGGKLGKARGGSAKDGWRGNSIMTDGRAARMRWGEGRKEGHGGWDTPSVQVACRSPLVSSNLVGECAIRLMSR